MRALLLLLVCAAAAYGLLVVFGGEEELQPGVLPEMVDDSPSVAPSSGGTVQLQEPRAAESGLLETEPGIPSIGVLGVDPDPTARLDWGQWREYRLPPRDNKRRLTGEDFLLASEGRLPIRFASAKLLTDFRKVGFREGQVLETHDEVALNEIYTLIGAGRLHFEEREAYLFIGLPPEGE